MKTSDRKLSGIKNSKSAKEKYEYMKKLQNEDMYKCGTQELFFGDANFKMSYSLYCTSENMRAMVEEYKLAYDTREDLDELRAKNDYENLISYLNKNFGTNFDEDTKITDIKNKADAISKRNFMIMKDKPKYMFNELFEQLNSVGYLKYIENESDEVLGGIHNNTNVGASNPFKIKRNIGNKNKTQLQMEFDEQSIEKNSDFEKYAKLMLWSNRAAKQARLVRNEIIDKYSNQNGKSTAQVVKDFSNIKKKMAFNTLHDSNLLSEFINLYESYIYGEINYEQLMADEVYKNVEEIQKGMGTKFEMNDLYCCSALGNTINNMYRAKDVFCQCAIDEYIKIKDDKEQVKHSKLLVSEDRENSLNGSVYSNILQFAIEGFNRPIMIHVTSELIDGVEFSNPDFKFERGYIASPSQISAIYKYDNMQLMALEQMSKAEKRQQNGNINQEVDYYSFLNHGNSKCKHRYSRSPGRKRSFRRTYDRVGGGKENDYYQR